MGGEMLKSFNPFFPHHGIEIISGGGNPPILNPCEITNHRLGNLVQERGRIKVLVLFIATINRSPSFAMNPTFVNRLTSISRSSLI